MRGGASFVSKSLKGWSSSENSLKGRKDVL